MKKPSLSSPHAPLRSPARRMAVLLMGLAGMSLLLPTCSAPEPAWDRKPVSRKTARQMEHYNAVYGPAPVLGQPAPGSEYQPKAAPPEGFATFR